MSRWARSGSSRASSRASSSAVLLVAVTLGEDPKRSRILARGSLRRADAARLKPFGPSSMLREHRSSDAAPRRVIVKLDIGMLTHDLKTLPDYARKVEAMGYDTLWSAETQHDPFLPLAVASTVSSRIKLGTNIATVFSRSPMITAMIAWDLQKASKGRFILGLGSQVKAHNERRFSVKFESPGPKMAEAVRAIRAIWDCWQNGTKLNFKGQFYTFDIMTPFFNPGPIEHPKIPIMIAAVNPYMCGVAGEFCDGMHVHPFNSPKYLREVVHPTVEAGLKKSGRARKDFTFATFFFNDTATTEK